MQLSEQMSQIGNNQSLVVWVALLNFLLSVDYLLLEVSDQRCLFCRCWAFHVVQTQQTLEVSSTPFMCVLHGGCVSSLDTGYGSCARNAQWEEVLCASCAVSNVQLQLGIAAPHWWHIPIANNKHSLGTIPFIISVCADLVVPNTVPDAFLRPRDDSADWGDITG